MSHRLGLASTPLTVLTTSYPRWGEDSAGSAVAASVRALRGGGIPVEVIAPEDPRRLQPGIVPLRYAPLRRLQTLCYGDGILPNLRSRPARVVLVPGLLAALWAAARRRRDRPIIAHWLVPGGLAAALAGAGRVVAVAHGSDVALLERMPGGRSLARLLADRCLAICCVSADLVRRVAALVGAGYRPTVLPPVCDCGEPIERAAARRQLDVSPRRPLVLFVGRLLETKGVDTLIDALAPLSPRPLAWVAGEGPLRSPLERRARALGVEVRFFGQVSPRQRASLLAAADLAVVPSRPDARGHAEGLPAVVLEAMAAGRPVIASAVGGIPEVVEDGETGWLVAPGDAAALARALRRAIGDRTLRARIGRNARRAAARWTPAHHAAALSALFGAGTRSP
ncbi:MAG: glycosyltransferase [Deltaproteobacteria bacterium]|nr:glycosyltransferase [Deltaproteobacteria bacterium]